MKGILKKNILRGGILKMILEKIENEKGKLKIMTDENPENPRDWDVLSKMVCFHRRYDLGDEHSYRLNDYNSWNELVKAIQKDYNVAIIYPLYLYDHSGITIDTSPFSCPWDSGQIGWVFVTKEDIRKEYNIKRVTKKYIAKAEKALMDEVKVYDDYLRGDVYGFVLEDKQGNVIDSCFGYYGNDFLEEIKSCIPKEHKELVEMVG